MTSRDEERGTRFYVRAIVDLEEKEHPKFGWIYQVVFRWYLPSRGWRYLVEHSSAFGVGLYVPVSCFKKT